MSAHTPGPWRVVMTGRKRNSHDIRAESGAWVCAHVVGGGTNDDGEANARLIAAAPDLLAQLKAIFLIAGTEGGGDVDGETDWGAVRDAIAKAEGKS